MPSCFVMITRNLLAHQTLRRLHKTNLRRWARAPSASGGMRTDELMHRHEHTVSALNMALVCRRLCIAAYREPGNNHTRIGTHDLAIRQSHGHTRIVGDERTRLFDIGSGVRWALTHTHMSVGSVQQHRPGSRHMRRIVSLCGSVT